jgi:hypothetical protein
MIEKTPTKGRIIVFGILFWYPLAGVTYQFLHYLIGLRRLGYDPYYVEDSGRWVYNPWRGEMTGDAEPNINCIAPILQTHGFAGRWAFRGNYPEGKCYGLTPEQLKQLYRDADAFLNITGAQEIREEHLACPRRIYVETDPVASQIRVAQGDMEMIVPLAAHDCHFSFGENLGAKDCGVPIELFRWQPTRQPVLLDMWDQEHNELASSYTTIATWENKGRDFTYKGEAYYWSKDREFHKVLDLSSRRDSAFEIALNGPQSAHKLLRDHGWRVLKAHEISADMTRYRDYIRNSRGEFTVAKDQNVRLASGWFSDRSACYLASGRPVITQDTGFGKILPTGRGLFSFKNLEDILSALDSIETDYDSHCRAARDIAGEYFAAERVIGDLVNRAGLS